MHPSADGLDPTLPYIWRFLCLQTYNSCHSILTDTLLMVAEAQLSRVEEKKHRSLCI